MCRVCGCGHDEQRLEGSPLQPVRAHIGGLSAARMVQIEQNIMSKNDTHAAQNRQWLRSRRIAAINLMSGPGAGKTTLLVRTLADISSDVPCTVIEGDQESTLDAERIRATGVSAGQINTGKGCHLDAHGVGHGLEVLQPPEDSLLFIENVGNLVCPAGFDLGEQRRVAILSVTEGEDKPLKYPDMFAFCNLLLITKTDLLPYVAFDVEKCMEYARRINPALRVLPVSATSGEGLGAWYEWLQSQRVVRAHGA